MSALYGCVQADDKTDRTTPGSKVIEGWVQTKRLRLITWLNSRGIAEVRVASVRNDYSVGGERLILEGNTESDRWVLVDLKVELPDGRTIEQLLTQIAVLEALIS